MKRASIVAIVAILVVAMVASYLMIKEREVPDLTGKKVLMIIAPENFRDEELLETREVLENKGHAEITLASKRMGEIRGMLGAIVTPDITLENVDVNDYDAVIFVGGSGAKTYFDDNLALSIAREAFENGKITCAICIAPVILANAGVLDGKQATVWDGEYIQQLKDGGAKYVNKPVVVDGSVITANGPSAAKEFGRTIARELAK